MRVGVIGAGWAGAAAVWQLHKNGHQALVFEAAPHSGGRARKHNSKALGSVIDNGQHILLGAYSSTLKLMQELGLNPKKSFYRFDLDIQSADTRFRFKTAPLPAPLHLMGPLLNTKGVRFSERLALVRIQRHLKQNQWQTQSGQSVLQLLEQTQQPKILIQKLWHPLCIAALNTPLDQACAQLFSNVLRDSLGGTRSDTQMLIPLVNMSDLWINSALAHADMHYGRVVQEIKKIPSGYQIHNESLDAVIVATNSPSCYKLLKTLDSEKQNGEFVSLVPKDRFNSIATLYLKPETPWANPHPMLMLDEDLKGLAAGQWVFNHAAIPNSELKHTIAITISVANRLQGATKHDITTAIIEQIQSQCRYPLPRIVASELITEKRATFVASPGLQRPTVHTPWPNLKLAGDWIQSPYPAVLEGAVRSGIEAANALGVN